jgi:hypothetical protein
MAFVTYNNTSTSATIGRPVVDVHAAAPPAAAAAPPRTSADAPVVPPSSSSSAPPPPPPRFLRATGSAPRPALLGADAGTPRDPDVPKSRADVDGHDDDDGIGNARSGGGGVSHKSRKQVREEERALRSGRAFDGSRAAPSASATEMYQPSPTEFAPTAHAAAIASRAARFRGAAASSSSSSSGGGGEPGPGRGVAMYDPRSGTDVAGLGVTGKHRSKHQINQLMASAISLEAHRASEAELARFGQLEGPRRSPDPGASTIKGKEDDDDDDSGLIAPRGQRSLRITRARGVYGGGEWCRGAALCRPPWLVRMLTRGGKCCYIMFLLYHI